MTTGAYSRTGNEFRVNTTTGGNQSDASITSLASGGFIITWTDLSASGGDTSGASIRAQMYDASGTAVGSEFLVNTATAGAQDRSTVTGLASGGFVVSWTDASLTGGDANGTGVKAQIYDASGARVGGEFLVNTQTTNNQGDSSITALSSGGFVVSWGDTSLLGTDRSGSGVKAQIYSASGVKLGGEFLVNTTTTADQITPSLTSLSNGGFIATWADGSRLGGDTSGYGIKAQMFSASGAKVGVEFLVNTSALNNQTQPVIASLASGKFVASWTDGSGLNGDTTTSVKAQVFNADGTRSGGELLVNTTTFATQQQPTITALPTGGFAISWGDNSIRFGDYSGFAIKTQFFDDNGTKVGTEFQVNTATLGNQDAPTITALASGALVISWTDASGIGGDASGTGIKAQIIAPTTGVITDIALTSTSFSEASAQNSVAAALSATGAVNANYHYQILSDTTGGAFRIDGSRLIVQDSLKLDFETSPNPSLTIRATDDFGNSFDEDIVLTITNALKESRYTASDELLVNTVTLNDQQAGTVTNLASGGFVVNWITTDGNGYGISSQIFDVDGSKVGAEQRVNTVTTGNQIAPTVGALANGGYVTAWTDSSGTHGGTGTAIVAQVFDSLGAKSGGEIVIKAVAGTYAQTDASITGLATGGFVVSWTDANGQNGDSSGTAILAQRYDNLGVAVGGAFLVNVATNGGQDSSSVTQLASGGFVVTWRDGSGIGGDTSSTGIKARIYDAGGNPTGSEFLVNTETRSSQLQPAVTELLGGGFVVTWTDNSATADPDYYGIKAQIFDSVGTKLGSEFLVNTATANSQQNAAIAPLASGGFVISWYDFSGTGGEAGGAGIRSQSFNAAGERLGAEVSVNGETLGAQSEPSIAALASGAYVVTYTDASGNGGDGSGLSIKARIFTPLLDPNAPPTLKTVDDSLVGTEDQPVTFHAADLLANDINGNGGILTITSVTAVAGGSLVYDDVAGTIVFTPNPNFDGRALFTYVVEDGTGASATGRSFIQFAGVNDAPTANNDVLTISEDTGTIANASLVGNDFDPDSGDRLTVVAVSATSALGIALSVTNGVVSYAQGATFQSLQAGQTVADSFSYTVSDTGGLTSSATVSLTIAGANDAPYGLALSNSTVDENAANGTVVGTASASDVDAGDTLHYLLTNNAGGRFAIDTISGVITVANGALLDYETTTSHLIGVRAVDAAGLSVDSSYVIAVQNLPEPRSYTGDNGANVFVAPTNDLWTISGNGGNDVLTGNASADTIYGGSGADILDGGGGADRLIGGIGNDTYYVDNVGDVVTEAYGEGTDIVYASVSFVLDANIENITLTGIANINATGNDFNNTMTGNDGNNVIDGGVGRDFIIGNGGDDILIGGLGGDWLQGNDGNDTLIGGAGVDELTGGAGADVFVFDQLTTSADADVVKDFAHGVDTLAFSRAVFTAFSSDPLGALSPGAFINGVQATTAAQHLIYNSGNGFLYYDADGVGGAAAIQIASLAKNLPLTSLDFNLIA